MFFSDGSPEDKLDDLALLASQEYNLGNTGNWFFSFRSGLNGLRSRQWGLQFHQRFVYEWVPDQTMGDHEHHIAAMLFCMDSAVECAVFALNALGQAVVPTGFRDVAVSSALRKISPEDISNTCTPGWASIFPSFRKHFNRNHF